jgi:peptide/nickel transport system ATP-binding protein
MYAGKIVETGTAMEVFTQPNHPYTQGLMACIPRPGETGHGRLGSIPGIVPSLVGDIEGCLFRNRCASMRPECEKGDIAIQMLSEGRGYRCVLSVEESKKRAQIETLSEAS